jgi:hypothetical protein
LGVVSEAPESELVEDDSEDLAFGFDELPEELDPEE